MCPGSEALLEERLPGRSPKRLIEWKPNLPEGLRYIFAVWLGVGVVEGVDL